jgi:hypothetical protein
MKRKTIYTDAPPEVDAALDYAVKHNAFINRQQFEDLLAKSVSVDKPKTRRNLRQVAAML